MIVTRRDNPLSLRSQLLVFVSAAFAGIGALVLYAASGLMNEAGLRLAQSKVESAATLKSLARVSAHCGVILVAVAAITLAAFVTSVFADRQFANRTQSHGDIKD